MKITLSCKISRVKYNKLQSGWPPSKYLTDGKIYEVKTHSHRGECGWVAVRNDSGKLVRYSARYFEKVK